jgi:hypothetical protein
VKRLLTIIILALSCTHCAGLQRANSTAPQATEVSTPGCTACVGLNKTNPDVLEASDLIRTAVDAEKKAAKARISALANYETTGVAIGLVRAHARANDIERGDWVWLVSVTHTQRKSSYSDQTTASTPVHLVWVRAKDGWVSDLLPTK